jgi:hypothetical protein
VGTLIQDIRYALRSLPGVPDAERLFSFRVSAPDNRRQAA